MASTQIFIVEDDLGGTVNGLNLGGGGWAVFSQDGFFNGGSTWPPFSFPNSSSPRASLTYKFDGTSLGITGVTAPTGDDQVFQAKIDNNPAHNSSNTKSQYYMQWYQSSKLPAGQHTITVDLLNGYTLDYLLVTPGPNTPLNGQTLMVDDHYTGIQYTKGWQSIKVSTFPSGITEMPSGGDNFMGTSHTTSTIGDSMTFSYTGNNASVFGVFLAEQSGSLSLTWSIDGGANFSKSLTSGGTPANTTGFVPQQPNYLLFDTGPLATGNHTLILTLADVVGQQTLVVDYILYSPSFPNLASMPNLTATSTTSVTSTSSTSTVGQTGTSTPTPPSDKKNNAGAIAGGVVGGIAALAIIAAFLLWWRRQRQRNDHEAYLPEPPSQPRTVPPFTIEPFSSHAPTSTAPSNSISMTSKPGIAAATVPRTDGSSNAGVSSFHHSAPSLATDDTRSYADANEHLQRQVAQLAAENARLAAEVAPPAYD